MNWEHKLYIAVPAEGRLGTLEAFVKQSEAEAAVTKEQGRRRADAENCDRAIRNAMNNNDMLTARIRVLEGEAKRYQERTSALESRIVVGARREASLGVDIEELGHEIKRLRETQIPTLNTIQKARYKHGTNFDRALGLKGDESLEVVIPRVIDEYMTLKTNGSSWERLAKEHGVILDRIQVAVKEVYPCPAVLDTEKCVGKLVTAFEAVKIRLNTVESAVKQAQGATVPPPNIEFRIKWPNPPGYPSAYLSPGV